MLNPTISILAMTTLVATPALLLESNAAIARTPPSILRINFAGVGGDNTHRYGTFVVPDRDTSVSADGGSLTRYDIHVAKMIEITHFQWCTPREGYAGVYYNYEANNGRVFMGKLFISCALAKETVERFGTEPKDERTELLDRGNPYTVSVPVLDLKGSKAKPFKKLVQSIKPECLDQSVGKLCPGDRSN